MTPDELLAQAAPPPATDLLVAMSGGPDSAVAAWVATQLSNSGAVTALHVHHDVAASDAMAAAAGAVATRVGISLGIAPVAVAPGPSWEGNAREARWDALRERAGAGTTIVTGHHRDDLAETTLGNLIRGAGATGLAAFAPARRGVWRPLVDVAGDDVRAVARALDLPFVDDPSNEDLRFTRNQLRHKVIPALEELNPRLRDALVRTAGALAADDATLSAVANAAPISQDAWGAWRVAAALITTADEATARRIARRLLRSARPPYAGTAPLVAEVIDVAGGATDRREVAKNVTVEREGPWLVIHSGEVAAPPPRSWRLATPAVWGGLEVIAQAPPRTITRRTSLVDAKAVGDEVVLRGSAEGERIEIAAGSKPLREVMAEAGIPRRLRSAWPVVEAHGRIAAVAGVRAAAWARGALGEPGTIELIARETSP